MRQEYRAARCYRSMLFVPGNRADWMLKAAKYKADALIFDLEDSVPVDAKDVARETVHAVLGELKDVPYGKFVRVNDWQTGHTLRDLLEVVVEGLDGVMLARAEDVDHVTALDLVLTDLERQRGLATRTIEIVPLCSTALAMYRHFEICLSSDRVRRSAGPGGVIAGGDYSRALAIRYSSDDGPEGMIVNGRSGLEARAAGVTQILGGMTTKIGDLDLVRRLAVRARSLGATGSMVIHPSHVPVVNEVFTPTASEIASAREMLQRMSRVLSGGSASMRFGGAMVDYAHVRSSLELLNQAKSFGLDVGDVPDVPVLSFNG